MDTVKIEVEERLAKRMLAAFENFESNETRLKAIDAKLDKLLGFEQQEAADLSELSASVAAGRTVDESTKTLVEGIASELADDPSPRIQALALQLRAQSKALGDAVTANT